MRAQFATLLDHEKDPRRSDQPGGRPGHARAHPLGIGATVLFLGLVVLTSLRTQRALVAPLRRLAGAVSALTAGDLTARVPEAGTAEVGEVVQGFNRMADALARQREALDDHQGELEAQKSSSSRRSKTLEEERNAHIDLVRHFGDRMIAEGGIGGDGGGRRATRNGRRRRLRGRRDLSARRERRRRGVPAGGHARCPAAARRAGHRPPGAGSPGGRWPRPGCR